MEKNNYWMLLVFALVLIIFALFSTKVGFHDSAEYISIAKNFAGIKNIDLFTGHSLFYPFIISLFLKIWPSLIMIKLVNVLWLFLIGIVLLAWLKNKKAFIIFAFSPLIWHVSIQTTPILPAAFFFLLAYIFLKKENLKYNLFYSGLCLGLSFAFHTAIILFIFLIILIYFWHKKFWEVFIYLIAIGIGFLPRMIVDYSLFKMPFYSIIRYFGMNLTPPSASSITGILKIFLILILISPFLFKLYKLNFKFYKKEIIFLILAGIVTIFIFVVGQEFKYFLIISMILFFLLAKVLTKRDMKWNAIISIIIIIIFAWGYFPISEDVLIQKDLKKIAQDFEVDYIIGKDFESLGYAVFLWENKPYFVWYQDFLASLENETTIRKYDFGFDSKINLKSRLKISVSFDRFEDKNYNNYILVTKKGRDFEELGEINLIKCYEVLCVYK